MSYKIGSIYTDTTSRYKRYLIILKIEKEMICYYYMDLETALNRKHVKIYNSNKDLFDRMINSWKMEG